MTPPPFNPRPVVMPGHHVRLEPLSPVHAPGLLLAGADADLWRYMAIAPPRTLADTEAWISAALTELRKGLSVPFAILDARSRQPIGSTRYLDLRPAHRAVEIGWTWVGSAYHRTPANAETLLLQMEHAFEALGAYRVQLKTDGRNLRAQAALEGCGTRKEGVLRRHTALWDGFVRDSVYYSVLDSEWGEVKAHLQRRIAQQESRKQAEGAKGPV